MNCKEIFGIQFRKARKELGLSQEEVAVKLGVARSVLSNWENGNTSPLLERLDEISQVLRKPISYFFESTGNNAQFGIGGRELADILIRGSESFNRLRFQATEMLSCLFLASTALEGLAISEALEYEDLRDKLEYPEDPRDIERHTQKLAQFNVPPGKLTETQRKNAQQELRKHAAESLERMIKALPDGTTTAHLMVDTALAAIFRGAFGVKDIPDLSDPNESEAEAKARFIEGLMAKRKRQKSDEQ